MIAVEIKKVSKPRTYYDSKSVETISFEDVKKISKKFNFSFLETEKKALENGVLPLRYVKNFETISITSQLKLLNSKVLLVGLGGVGGYVLENLVRMGVGDIEAFDYDFFEESNLNRQILSKTSFSFKAEAAEKRVKEINPSINFSAEKIKIDDENIDTLIKEKDIIVDALGGLSCRKTLQRAAQKKKIPLVTGGVAGVTGFVSFILPNQKKTYYDLVDEGDEASDKEEKLLGSLVQAVSVVGSLMAMQTLLFLTDKKPTLQNKILFIDIENNFFETVLINEEK